VKSFVFFILWSSLIFSNCTQNKSNSQHFHIEEIKIDSLLQNYHAAGIAVAIVQENEIVYAKGFGYRDVENQLPVDEHTIFGIGSITKSFTASLVGILEAQGKLQIKDNPRKYLNELQFYNSEMDDQIQLHHLLNHSSGLSNMSTESSAILFTSSNTSEIITRLKYLKPIAKVGERLMYSNYMYGLAAEVVAEITEKSWQKATEEELFQKLGMKHSFAQYEKAKDQKNFSKGYAVSNEQPDLVLPERIPFRAASGDIFSSVYDMSQWILLWMNRGKNQNNQQILSESYIDKALQSYLPFPTGNHDSILPAAYYGYGWLIRNYKDGLKRVEHSGGVSGYSSNLVFFPEKQLGIVVLTNQTSSSLAHAVTDLFLEKLLDKKVSQHPVIFSESHQIESNVLTKIKASNPPSHSLQNFVGKYHHSGYGEINIIWKDSILLADFPLTRFRLEHVNGNVFHDRFTEEIPLVMWNFMRFEFLFDKDNATSSLHLNIDEPRILFKKIKN